MKLLIPLLFFALTLQLASEALADSVFKYRGEATKDGKLVYAENHTLTLGDNGKIKNAETIYLSPDNKEIARLSSDFESSFTTPNHILQNFLTGNLQGIKRKDSEIIMFTQNRGEEEKQVALLSNAEHKTYMGCQGLNYYLLENLTKLKDRGSFPLRFLIPAKLDFYDFNVSYVGETAEGMVEIEIAIDNWLLSLFAPKLKVLYDKENKRIAYYEGLSNIPDENGKMQSVAIHYKYET